MRPRPVLGTLALVAAGVPALAQHASPNGSPSHHGLDALVPADALAYVEFAGLEACSEACTELGLYELWREPEMQEFVRGLVQAYEQVSAETPREVLEQWEMGKHALGGSIAIAAGDLTIVWEDRQPVPMPSLIAALDTTGREDAVHGLFDMALSRITGSEWSPMTMEVQERHGEHVVVLRPNDDDAHVSLHCAFVDNLLLIGLNRYLFDECLEIRANGGRGSLARSDVFQRSRAKAESNRLVEAFLNVGGIHDRIGGLLPYEVQVALEHLGLDDVNGLYYASAVHDGDSFDTLYLDAPAPRGGLLDLSGDRGVGPEVLAAVPATAAFVNAVSFSPEKAWDTVFGTIEALAPPQAVAEMYEEMGRAERELGFEIRGGLLEAMGDELVIYAEVPQNGFIPTVVASLEIEDHRAAESVLETLLRMGQVGLRHVDYRDWVLNVIDMPGEDLPVSPCFAVLGDRIVVSLTVGGLKSGLRNLSGGENSLLESANFQDAVSGLPWERASYVQFVDLKRIGAFAYNAAENLLPGMDTGGAPIDLAALPDSETVLAHLNGWAEVAAGDDDGIVWKARTLSMASLLAVASRGLMEAPGCPPYLLGGVAYRAQSSPGGWEESYVEATPDAPSAVPTQPGRAVPPPPANVVNPVDADSEQARQLAVQEANLTRQIEQTPEVGALYFQRASTRHQIHRFADAAEDFERARELGFQALTCAYNIACCHSLEGDTDEAIGWLHTALDEGFDDLSLVTYDSDLDNLRGDSRFDKLVAEYFDGE